MLTKENLHVEQQLSESKAKLSVLAKKNVKISEIENIKVKESVFGKKVTLDKDDYDNITSFAKKYVISVKNTKKLKAEN